MECCTRGSRAAHEELVGDDAGDAVASPRQQVVFDSVDLMEAWVAEGGWTCLLLVGNNAAGYTEQAYKVQSGWHTASYAFSTHMVNPWISRPILTRRCCGPTGCHGQRAAAIGRRARRQPYWCDLPCLRMLRVAFRLAMGAQCSSC